mmetsp:Transcript_8831/g.26092  ORF Transcript_8831/g.26092 Transcript_8831/m.26092 type:complete len:280 (+) Transcript_8831:1241-2080(+)
MRGVPVRLLVDVVLAVRGHDQRPVGQGHVGHAVAEVELLLRLVEDVVNRDRVVLVQGDVHVLPREGAVHQAREEDRAAAAAAGELGAVVGPGDGEDRAGLRGFAAVGPASPVAELQDVVGADGEVLAGRGPGDGGHHVVQGRAGEEPPAVRVPDVVAAVLAGGEDRVVHVGPIDGSHDAVVRLPLHLLLPGLNGLQVDLVAAGEEEVLAVGRPTDRVDRAGHLGQGGAQHAAARPDLDGAVLPGRGDGGAVVVPLQGDDGASVGVHLLLLAPALTHQSE